MNVYQEYKDSGIKWLGSIPSSWDTKRIKHNTYVKGRVGWQGLSSDEYGDVGPYLVTGTDFIEGRINWEKCHHISEKRYEEDPFIQLRKNDLLITKDGTIGKIALVDDLSNKATLNSGVFVIRPQTEDYIPTFMYWVLNSSAFELFIDYTKTGSTVQHLYQRVFVEFAFPVPPLSEQRRIADFLDSKTTQIDTLIGKKQRQIELLREQRTAIINNAVTKGLNPDVPMKDSEIEWLGEIPEEWSRARIKDICFVGDGNHGEEYPDEQDFTDEETGVPFIRVTEFRGFEITRDGILFITREKNNAMRKGGLRENDILFVNRGSIGKIALVNKDFEGANLNSQIAYFRIVNQKVQYKYLLYYLSSDIFQKLISSLVHGGALKQLPLKRIVGLQILIPPQEEQKAIANFLDQKTFQFGTLIEKKERQIELLREQRVALISSAVTGKIDIRQEPM